jgi:hypothetical protein
MEQPRARDSSPKFQDVIATARPHFRNGEFQELKELLTEYEDIFAVGSEDYGFTNNISPYRCGKVRPIRQTPRRLPVEKQADVAEMLDDMQRRGYMEESASLWSSPVVLVRKKN